MLAKGLECHVRKWDLLKNLASSPNRLEGHGLGKHIIVWRELAGREARAGQGEGVNQGLIEAKAEWIKIIQMAKCKNKKHSFTARRATSRNRFVAGRPVWSQGSPTRVPTLPQELVLSVLRAQPLASSDRAWRFNMQQSKHWVTLFSYYCSCYSHHRMPPCGRGSHKARASETGDAIQQKCMNVTWQV